MRVIISRTEYQGNNDRKTSSLCGLEYLVVSESPEDNIILSIMENNPEMIKFSLRDDFFWTYNPKIKRKK